MSGIAGILHRSGRPVDRETLIRMTDRLAHRGPDGAGHWDSGPVGLGSRFFWTTPESVGEKQPIQDPSGQFVIVFDGRLDNRDEVQGGSVSDAEIVLEAYRQWGEHCASRLLGDFAFAIWDDVRKRMYCARDHFGTKPFCYHLSGELFVFATEVKGVLAVEDVPERVDEGRILDYLARVVEGPDQTTTFYHDVKKLPPAHWMTVSADGVKTERYWSLDPTRETRFGSDEEYAEAFRSIFEEAVRCRLRGADPVGSMLSGGLDSSAIVGMARKLLEEDDAPAIRTFSAISGDGKSCGETQGVRAMIDAGGLEPYTCTAEETHVYVSHFERIMGMTDNPFDDFILNVPMAMYALAADQGVRVLMDGLDGDRVCSMGWEAVAFHFRKGHFGTFAKEARGLADFFGGYSSRSGPAYTASLARRVLSRRLPEGLMSPVRTRAAQRRAEKIIDECHIRPEFAERHHLADRLSAYGRMSCGGGPDLTAVHVCLMEHPDLTVALERYDRVAAAFGIECRRPLLDKRLVEFCVSIPWERKVYRGTTKRTFREAVKGLIPEEVRLAGRRRHLGPDFSTAILEDLHPAWSDLPGEMDRFVVSSKAVGSLERYAATPNAVDREVLLAVIAFGRVVQEPDLNGAIRGCSKVLQKLVQTLYSE